MTSQIIQGRQIDDAALGDIRELLQLQPPLSRTAVSRRLALRWNWRANNGQLKDIAARSLLRKLHDRQLIQLPPPRCLPPAACSGLPRAQSQPQLPLCFSTPELIDAPLHSLQPIRVSTLNTKSQRLLLAQLLQAHHYLGWNRMVGQSIPYCAHDRHGRLLALCLWGAAAWKIAPRDQWIGWSSSQRSLGLKFIANNHRLLLLPWVKVPHLGSHFLSQIQRRIRADWQAKYHQDLYLLESFVQADRFAGTLYQAAGWICVGHSQGRSRQDCFNNMSVPIKSIWLYPLELQFGSRLCSL